MLKVADPIMPGLHALRRRSDKLAEFGDSSETIAYALRAYANLISRPAYDEIGPFRVDVWDGTGIVETMAKCSHGNGGRAR